MAYDDNILYVHRTQILELLSPLGLTRPRVLLGALHDECEIVVTVASTTSILDIARGERELRVLLGIDVDIVPDKSERGLEVEASAVAL